MSTTAHLCTSNTDCIAVYFVKCAVVDIAPVFVLSVLSDLWLFQGFRYSLMNGIHHRFQFISIYINCQRHSVPFPTLLAGDYARYHH